MATIAIVGAGLAGLAAGRALADAGHAVTLFEKSRGVGGRAATRRVGAFRFDHGAQYLKAPDAATQALLSADAGGGPAVDIGRPVWLLAADGQISPGDAAQNAEPKWTWADGITAPAKALARGLPVRTEVTVAAIRPTGAGYRLHDADGAELGRYDAALLTAPAPQSAAILRASPLDPQLREALAAELDRAAYRRCISLSMAYERRPELPWYALVNLDRGHPISWLACEHDKPGRAPAGAGLLTAQMAPAWSEQHWEALPRGSYGEGAPLPAALAALAATLRELAGDLGPPLWANAQRWRYALPDSGCDGALLNGSGSRIYFAGDFLPGQGRMHLALHSGREVAAQIIAEL
jgi:predicted NAD/FAD-dependent oxidoreductase